MPIESVCSLFKAKIDFLIDKFETLGVWDILKNVSPANAQYEQIRKILDAVDKIRRYTEGRDEK